MPLTARKGKDKHGNALKDDRALSVRLGAESVVLAAADVPDLVVDEYAFNFGKEVVRHALSPGTPLPQTRSRPGPSPHRVGRPRCLRSG